MKKLLVGAFALLLASAVGAPLGAQEEPSAAEKKLNTVMEELQESFRKWQEEEREKMEKAAAEGKPMPAMRMAPPPELFAAALKKVKEASVEFAGTDDAILFHGLSLQIATSAEDKDAATAAAETLVSNHMKSEKLIEAVSAMYFGRQLIGAEKVAEYLAKIAKESPHASVRAEAFLLPLRQDLENATTDSGEYKNAKIKALAYARESGDAETLAMVQSIIDGREKLVAGGMAADIEGVDLDGVAFKLSDYKGKVVLLDFWGDW